MAPGYRSPFDHPPSLKPIHNADVMPTALAILLCLSIIVCLILFVFCTATRHLRHQDNACVPAQEMLLDQSFFPKNLVMRPGEDLQTMVNIRDKSHIDDLQQPLLLAGRNSNSLANDAEMATRRHDNAYKGSIHWHGINTLNTSWGWMA